MPAILSTLGLYRNNPDLFAGIEFPEAMEELDHETLIWNLLAECAELEVLYPDADFMQAMIARWAASRMQTWERLYAVMYAEYNPLWNKDAHIVEILTTGPEKETRTYGQKQGSVVYGQQQDTDAYGARTSTHNLGVRHAEGTNQVSAFNSSTYEPSEKSTSDQNAATDSISDLAHTDTHTAGTHTDTTTENQHIDTSETLEHYTERVHDEQGNIGVTTSQQMAEAEIKLRCAYNLYDIIIQEYKCRFCLLVY